VNGTCSCRGKTFALKNSHQLKGFTMFFETDNVRFRAAQMAIDTVGHEDGEWVELADLIVAFVNEEIEWLEEEDAAEEINK